MNILKTFEIFLREPLSILKQRIIQIVNINSEATTQVRVNADLLNQKTQITVINSEKMYKLLRTVQQKKETQAAQKLLTSNSHQQVVLGKLFGRA